MATEYSRELSAELHATWMALHAIRSDIPFDTLNHERWMKLADAMRVIVELKNENFDFLEQKIHKLTASLNLGGGLGELEENDGR
jgi:hypothetical protein